MKIGLFSHGGSGNHGCEALVRSTVKLLGNHEYTLFSECPQDDERYGLEEIVNILPAQNDLPDGIGRLVYMAGMKLCHDDGYYWRWRYRDFRKKAEGLDMALSIGGDNYCYQGFTERFSILNKAFVKNGIPVILWGCSIDKDRIDAVMLNDLRRYRLIFARESITFDALSQAGLENVRLMPDAAFILDEQVIPLPCGFVPGNMVGLNISPLVARREYSPGSVNESYRNLMDFILSQTDMGVALIPHVVWRGNDDRDLLRALYRDYASCDRVVMVGDNDAGTLKYIIRNCRFMVAARTHASIAAYSTGVPTLTIGYSVKSRGIATDLFGTAEHYVLPVGQMKDGDELTDAFRWLMDHEDDIRSHYDVSLGGYVRGLRNEFLYEAL